MKVKAYLKSSPTSNIKLGGVDISPKDNDLIVRSTHVGLARGDVFILENEWNATVYPAIGTGETIGVVEQVGKNTKGFKKGDRVRIGYILGACMKCEYCKKRLYHYCQKQLNTELGGWGGFAEKVCIDYRLVAKVPEKLNLDETTPLLCYGVTAYSGIIKANLDAGSNVGVIGLGGLGHIAIKILKALDMNITVISHSPEKRELALRLGANNFVNTNKSNWSEKLSKKFDLIINTSPADLNLQRYVELLKPDGKFCYLGLPSNKQEFNATQLADYGSRIVYGSYVGSVSEMEDLLQLAVTKNIKAEIVKFPISKIEEAIKFVKSGKTYKRVVLEW